MSKSINRYIPEPVLNFLNSTIHLHIKYESIFEYKTYNLDIEGLVVICDIIIRMSGRWALHNGFCEIGRECFTKILHHDYKVYLDYLIENKIVLTDNFYVPKEKSKSYKINEDYLGELKVFTMDNQLFIKRTLKSINEKVKLKISKEHKNNFLKDFKLDFDGAVEHLIWRYSNNIPDKKGQYLTNWTKLIAEHKLLQIRDNQLYMSRSDSNGRINSNLTSLNGFLKSFILGYETQLDISASQPTILIVLINWIKMIQAQGSLLSHPSYNSLTSHVCKMILKYLGNVDGARFIKELKNVKIPSQDEINLYKKLCYNGEFYQHFIDKYKNKGVTLTKDKLKVDVMFPVFYSSNRNVNEDKKIFQSEFPTIYKMMCDIKGISKMKKGYAILAIILQSIESHIWVDNVLEKLDKMGVKYHFIHDAIIVKEVDEYRAYVAVLEQFNKYGISPKLIAEDLKTGDKKVI